MIHFFTSVKNSKAKVILIWFENLRHQMDSRFRRSFVFWGKTNKQTEKLKQDRYNFIKKIPAFPAFRKRQDIYRSYLSFPVFLRDSRFRGSSAFWEKLEQVRQEKLNTMGIKAFKKAWNKKPLILTLQIILLSFCLNPPSSFSEYPCKKIFTNTNKPIDINIIKELLTDFAKQDDIKKTKSIVNIIDKLLIDIVTQGYIKKIKSIVNITNKLLMEAAIQGHIEKTESIVNIINKLLMEVFKQGRIKMAKFILEEAESVNINFQDELGNSFFHHLLMTNISDRKMIKMLRFLRQNNFDITLKTNLDKNILHASIKQGRQKLAIEIIEKHKIDVKSKDKDGNTALFYAIKYGGESVEFFIGRRLSIKKRKANLIEKLIEHGADIHQKNNKGETPKSLLEEMEDSYTLDILIKKYNKMKWLNFFQS